MSRKRAKRYTDILEELGLEPEEISIGGNGHLRIEVTHRGKRGVFSAPYSVPETGRRFLNWKGDVKRWKREVEKGNA